MSARPLVYRVQDRHGRGPWKPGFSESWVEDRTDAEFDAIDPFPMNVLRAQVRRARGMHVGHACLSLDQLRLWFTPGEYRKLLGHGYRAVRIPVDTILVESPSQCLFARRKPMRVGALPVAIYPHKQEVCVP